MTEAEIRRQVEAEIVAWLRQEAGYARHAQETHDAPQEKVYRMGQKDGLLIAADTIERGEYDHFPEIEHGGVAR